MTTDTIAINNSLKRFEENRDNPMVKSLKSFIVYTLGKALKDVESWGIEDSDKPSRMFYLRFADGTRMSGQLAEAWTVQVFALDKGQAEEQKEVRHVQ